MRITMGVLVLALACTGVMGQSNEDKYKKKLEKDFVSKISWVQSLEKAQSAAAAQEKLIFGYFTRSYAP